MLHSDNNEIIEYSINSLNLYITKFDECFRIFIKIGIFQFLLNNILNFNQKIQRMISNIHSAINFVSNYIDNQTNMVGGIVYFPEGNYITRQIVMKSNSYLYLDKKATIYAATSWNYYPSDPTQWILITSNHSNNFGIFVDGIINGQNHKYFKEYNEPNDIYIPNT